MSKPLYLLDLDVLAELTRPNGNRRVFTLFQQRQSVSALAAPVLCELLQGVESLADTVRRRQLQAFNRELLDSGLPVLPFDREAALWLAREAPRHAERAQAWGLIEGQVAAIAATRELTLVSRNRLSYTGTRGLLLEDWFNV